MKNIVIYLEGKIVFSDVKIKTFDLPDLIGRKLEVRAFSEKSTEIVVAVDMETGDFFCA